MYCAEIALNRPLYDPGRVIESLKTQVARYSPQLKQAIIKDFLWRARFTLDNLAKPAARGETYLVTGGLARAIHCFVQVLYAFNETYYLSEKKLVRHLGSFQIQPEQFLERINSILGAPGTTSQELQEALGRTEVLYQECCALGAENR
jgi:hypothetical protein